MSCWLRFSALLVLIAASQVPEARSEDKPKTLRIEATAGLPMRRNGWTHIEIEPDGTARIAQSATSGGTPTLALSLRLSPAEMAAGRRAVTAARFFQAWGPRTLALHQGMWEVTVTLGKLQRVRGNTAAYQEFGPLRDYLHRFIVLADAVAGLRRGEPSLTRSALRPDRRQQIVQPSLLTSEIVASAAAQDDPRRCAATARLLVALPEATDWIRGVKELLPKLEGGRRTAVLSAWGEDLRSEKHAEHRDEFVPVARSEVSATWDRWLRMPQDERLAFWFLQSMLLQRGDAEAFAVAERMARTLGTPAKPLVSPGLLRTGEAAMPIVVRLLDAPEVGARASGAKMAYTQIRVVRGRMGIDVELSTEVLATMDRRFAAEIVPRLEKLSQDAKESHAVRRTCLRALDAYDGRVAAAKAKRIAEGKARRARAEAERAKAPPAPTPAGTETIAGRLVCNGDIGLPGFRVHARSRTGPSSGSATTTADGSFRIGGLATGPHDLSFTIPGQRARWAWARGRPTAADVASGRTDVVLHLPGSLIRGRLVDDSGTPVVKRRIIAQMRNAPSDQGPAYSTAVTDTDAHGRFWLVELIPGTYDLQVAGHLALDGAEGLKAGPQERTVRMQAGAVIAGRVVDETGAPLAKVHVSLERQGSRSDTRHGATTRSDGTFRFRHLRPTDTYRVSAQLSRPKPRFVIRDGVTGGTTDLELRIDTTPRLRFRVEAGPRLGPAPQLRIERIDGGPGFGQKFEGLRVSWPAAPAGTWRVFAYVRDHDAAGNFVRHWLEIGRVTTGQPEKTLTVPP